MPLQDSQFPWFALSAGQYFPVKTISPMESIKYDHSCIIELIYQELEAAKSAVPVF